MYQQRFSPPDAVDGRVAAVEREQSAIVGMGGPHNCDGKTLITVSPHERFFAGYLVARVLPERVFQRRLLGDRKTCRRLLIGRRGTDEDKLARAAAKKGKIYGNMLRREGDPVDNHVESVVAQRFADSRRFAYVANQDFGLRRNRAMTGLPSVEKIEIDSLLDRQRATIRAKYAATADKQSFHE